MPRIGFVQIGGLRQFELDGLNAFVRLPIVAGNGAAAKTAIEDLGEAVAGRGGKGAGGL